LGARIVSVVLGLGGLAGIIASAEMALHLAHEGRAGHVVVPVISIPLFAWCVIKAVDLWRGRAAGYRWAKLLFLLQIPAFCLSRLTYEFSTALSARILVGHSDRLFGANIGSSLNLLVSREPMGWLIGINVVALLAFLYLLVVTRQKGVSCWTP
jgi:hypothetical protein